MPGVRHNERRFDKPKRGRDNQQAAGLVLEVPASNGSGAQAMKDSMGSWKDCSSCPSRVELHPEYADEEFIDTPCSACDVQWRRSNAIRYDDTRHYESPTTSAHRGFVVDSEFWHDLTPRQKKIICAMVNNPMESRVNVAKMLGICRQRLYQQLNNIRAAYNRNRPQ